MGEGVHYGSLMGAAVLASAEGEHSSAQELMNLASLLRIPAKSKLSPSDGSAILKANQKWLRAAGKRWPWTRTSTGSTTGIKTGPAKHLREQIERELSRLAVRLLPQSVPSELKKQLGAAMEAIQIHIKNDRRAGLFGESVPCMERTVATDQGLLRKGQWSYACRTWSAQLATKMARLASAADAIEPRQGQVARAIATNLGSHALGKDITTETVEGIKNTARDLAEKGTKKGTNFALLAMPLLALVAILALR